VLVIDQADYDPTETFSKRLKLFGERADNCMVVTVDLLRNMEKGGYVVRRAMLVF
jgi:hypothetical protein